MADFLDVTEYLKPLALPIAGTTYTIPPLPYDVGLSLTASDEDVIEKMTADEFRRTFLGTALDAMIADQVPLQYVARAALTALADFQGGREVAAAMWASGGSPLALEQYVEAKRREALKAAPQDRKAPTSSRSTGGATTTKRRASTRATTPSPKKS